MVRQCISCKEELSRRWQNKFCSNKCQADQRYALFKSTWLKGNAIILTINISGHIRRYLLERNGEKCSECGWNKRNPSTGRVPLEVDHVDGNATNNSLENLRLICANCHSLTPSYRNLNRGKGRTTRKGSMKWNSTKRS